jgi:Fe-S-cluster containining protein
MPDLITDLEQIKQLAATHHDNFEVMRYRLQLDDEINDSELDTFVDEIAAPIIDRVDCTQCANCCRSLDVYVTESDVHRLSVGIHIPVDEIITQRMDRTAVAEVGEWGQFREHPCTFLNGKRCSVYAHRPESCRIYPAFTPDFRWTLKDTISGAAVCPIIYNVLSQLLEKIDEITA